MNILNSVNLAFENLILLALKPKSQTEPNSNFASQKPVWNRFGILQFFGHPNLGLVSSFLFHHPHPSSQQTTSS